MLATLYGGEPGVLETATTGHYLLILNASQRAKHAEGNMFLYEQSPELRVSTVLLKGHARCPHKDTVHYTHTHTHSTSYYNAILKFPLQAICTEYLNSSEN